MHTGLIVSETERGSQTCTVATHVEWGRYKAFQRLFSARGDNFPSTRATPLFCPPSLLNQSLGHGWSAFHLIFYISSPSSFILVLVSLFFSGSLSFFSHTRPLPFLFLECTSGFLGLLHYAVST